MTGNPCVSTHASIASISACNWHSTSSEGWRVESTRRHGYTISDTVSRSACSHTCITPRKALGAQPICVSRGRRSKNSLSVHPWRIVNSTPQTSQDVERRLHAEIDAITALIETHGLPAKKKAVDKVRTQLAGLSALVDLWWQRVRHDVQQVALTPMWQRWVDEHLLPLLYWQHQVSRTRCPRRKAKLLQALESAQEAFDMHRITTQLAPEVLEDWKAWAAEHAKTFQRASSAVEGRNGALAQLHHNQRGIPKQRYKVWTVLHNFDCRAPDGTTPASRFFRRAFPDLFETVLSHIDTLPRSRQRKRAVALSHWGIKLSRFTWIPDSGQPLKWLKNHRAEVCGILFFVLGCQEA